MTDPGIPSEYYQDLYSKMAGKLSRNQKELEILREMTEALEQRLEKLEARLEKLAQRIEPLEKSIKTRVKSNQKFEDYDREMKTKFFELPESGEGWEPWCLLYWFRWLRRNTNRIDPVTSWSDYKSKIGLCVKLVDIFDGIIPAKNYLEYVVYGPHGHDLVFRQACAGSWISTLSGQVDAWIEDKEASERMKNQKTGTELE
jgi:hypothetical protein